MDKLVEGKKYHIVARFIDDDVIFVKMGIVGIPEYPVLSSLKGVNQMLPWIPFLPPTLNRTR